MSNQKMLIGYYRLSLEDGSDGESNSIINQRKLVKDYISHIPELAELPFQEFYDDGYSGSSMERPGIQQVLELARNEQVQCIVVKDFSRFSRDYIEMGTYLEQIFPFLGIRFISVSDHYDSKDYKGKSSDIEVQFKGLIADFYVKDQSVKVKSAVSTKRSNGEYCCGSAPYGYRINPENKKELLIVEEEAAEKYGLEMVNVVPQLKAGGSFATAAYAGFEHPTAVERIQAHAGIDIGDTFIGMHLRPVAVPVRTSIRAIGGAHVTCARTRLKYIGGERAHYLDAK